MRLILFKIGLLLCALISSVTYGQKVENVRIGMLYDKVIIQYDLVSTRQSNLFDIDVKVVLNDSQVYIPKTLTGDLMEVAGGKRKRIAWMVENDVNYLVGSIHVELEALPAASMKIEMTSTEEGTQTGIGLNEKMSQKSPKELEAALIGRAFEGGKIAYIYKQGDVGYVRGEVHGIIAANEDLIGQYSLECGGKKQQVNLSRLIGHAALNTAYFASVCPADGKNAAVACFNLVSNGYDDWVLPTSSELMLLFQNKDLIGNFQPSWYLSSSSSSKIEETSFQDFYLGIQRAFAIGIQGNVRPIRYF